MMRRLALFLVLLSAPVLAGDLGQDVYKRCAACHLPDRTGVPGAFPPLDDHIAEFATTKTGRDYLVAVISRGIAGAMEIDGVAYRGFMPPQGALSDEEIAAVLNFLVADSAAEPFSAQEVAAIRATHKATSPHDVRALREQVTEQREAPR